MASKTIKRLELSVRSDNISAVKLYLNQGFKLEGTKQNSMNIAGIYKDEYIMAKLFDY